MAAFYTARGAFERHLAPTAERHTESLRDTLKSVRDQNSRTPHRDLPAPHPAGLDYHQLRWHGTPDKHRTHCAWHGYATTAVDPRHDECQGSRCCAASGLPSTSRGRVRGLAAYCSSFSSSEHLNRVNARSNQPRRTKADIATLRCTATGS